MPDRSRIRKKKKNPAAVALGRRGGLKGGPARAKKMTAEQRRASALKAATARWTQKYAGELSEAGVKAAHKHDPIKCFTDFATTGKTDLICKK